MRGQYAHRAGAGQGRTTRSCASASYRYAVTLLMIMYEHGDNVLAGWGII
jgi:hypothetical protein